MGEFRPIYEYKWARICLGETVAILQQVAATCCNRLESPLDAAPFRATSQQRMPRSGTTSRSDMVTLSEPSRPDPASVAEGPMATQSPRFHIGSDGDAHKRRVASRRPAIRRGIRCGPRVGVASREGVPASRRATSCSPCAHGARARRPFPRRIPWRCSASPCGMRFLSRAKRPSGRPAAVVEFVPCWTTIPHAVP